MKFNIIPEEIAEFEYFQNKKDKSKKVWIWVTWGFIRWKEFHSSAFSFSEDCKTIEEIQSKLDEVLKKAVPVSKDKKDEFHLDYKNEDDLYNTMELSKVLQPDTQTEWDNLFINDDSGGGANAQVFKWKNVTEKEKQKTVKETCRDEENISLEDAAESWQDDVLENDFGYQSIVGESFYRLPLKVVNVLTEEEQAKLESSVEYQIDKNDSAKRWKSKIDFVFTRNKPAKAKLETLQKQLANVKAENLDLIKRYYEQKHGDTEFKGSGIKKIDNTAKIKFLKGLK